MGFFTDAERQSLRIEGMILHVVGEEEFTPEPALGLDHAAFFVARMGSPPFPLSRETLVRVSEGLGVKPSQLLRDAGM